MKRLYIIFCFYLFVSTSVAQVSFQYPDTIYITYSNTYFCIIEDFNNDALKDLVIVTRDGGNNPSSSYKILMYKQENNSLIYHGKISYPKVFPGIESISSGDLNNDSLTDLVLSYYRDTVMIFFQNINGFFNEQEVLKFYSGKGAYGLACGDLNNDTLVDLAVSFWHEDSLKIYYQQKNGSFIKRTYYKQISVCNELFIRDMNRDGLNDVVLTNGWHISNLVPNANKYTFAIYLQDNSSHFLQNHLLFKKSADLMNNYITGFDIADINNDGFLDIATVNSFTGLSIWYHDSTNNLMFENYPPEIDTWHSAGPVRAADFDNDGKKEIVIGHGGWGKISVYEPDENYHFSDYTLCYARIESNTFQNQTSIGDLNNDGQIDLVYPFGQGACILYNNSDEAIINEVSNASNFNIFPNPATTHLTITNTSLSEKETIISIFNSQGQLLLSETLLNQNTATIDISQLPAGIYMVKLQLSDGNSAQKKFVVIK